ncbi:hypothetical protein CLV78_10458 [Aliiruegeria haliotis]|uniref:Uncharacterized protein n=1 Tax=Aliiruegeria haliotis TaxID=1280846 RepID=A0A2T0RQX0_9RHOB|nr:hypothetical protein CLV78_10458 [Aliiruegeria haliotis]
MQRRRSLSLAGRYPPVVSDHVAPGRTDGLAPGRCQVVQVPEIVELQSSRFAWPAQAGPRCALRTLKRMLPRHEPSRVARTDSTRSIVSNDITG